LDRGTVSCRECGALYRSEWEARYCATQDLDPRNENERLRAGSQRETVKPVFENRQGEQTLKRYYEFSGTGESLRVKESRRVDISYRKVGNVITDLTQLSEGLEDAEVVFQDDHIYGWHATVEGWRKPTAEEMLAYREQKKEEELQERRWLANQAATLRAHGFIVEEKEGKN